MPPSPILPLRVLRSIRLPTHHADRPRTSWITDPDGYRIELVQWPTDHADGITKADFPEPTDPARMPAAH